MNDPIIECREVCKHYRPRKQPPKESLLNLFGLVPRKRDPFCALENISFEIMRGEAVGIFGENGSGKTTLLKLIASITVPSEGSIQVRGRIGSLLEVGAGFHPDMTGEENIYLSGAILGVSHQEMAEKFDAIVEFSELKDFIQIPVKNYSSGMYVRLGFSVAIFTEPEILLLDEILAVGDEQFQQKCLKAIRKFMDHGGTIVYVSHDWSATKMICSRSLVLHDSHLVFDGDVAQAIDRYHHQLWLKYPPKPGEHTDVVYRNRFGSFEATIDEISFFDKEGSRKREFQPAEPLGIEINYTVHRKVDQMITGLFFQDASGYMVYVCSSHLMNFELPIDIGSHSIGMQFEQLNLQPGLYDVTIILASSYIITHTSVDWRDYAYDVRYYMTTIQVLPGPKEPVLRTGFLALDVEFDPLTVLT